MSRNVVLGNNLDVVTSGIQTLSQKILNVYVRSTGYGKFFE